MVRHFKVNEKVLCIQQSGVLRVMGKFYDTRSVI